MALHMMSPAEIEHGLILIGVPRAKAHAEAYGLPSGRLDTVILLPPTPTEINLVLPWSSLVSDNDKYTATYTKGGSPRIMLTLRYREAKKAIVALAREAMAGALPMAGPVELTVAVYVPDNRSHDIVNFSKIVQDSLEKVIFVNDNQIHRAVWLRAGVDVDRPRAMVTVTAFA